MLDRLQRESLALSWKTGNDTMAGNGSDPHQDRARRFRDAALPYLDDVYTLARYLLRDTTDAEDAVQECYLRALRHFDTFRGPAIKPWLFAILRNVCRGEFARRSSGLHYIDQDVDGETDKDDDAVRPLWQEPQVSPETEVLHQRMHKQSAVSLQSFPTSFGRRSSCAKSTICPIARLPTWSVYRSER
jgi:RNA polymerase sigma factor (sigma-70 family)